MVYGPREHKHRPLKCMFESPVPTPCTTTATYTLSYEHMPALLRQGLKLVLIPQVYRLPSHSQVTPVLGSAFLGSALKATMSVACRPGTSAATSYVPSYVKMASMSLTDLAARRSDTTPLPPSSSRPRAMMSLPLSVFHAFVMAEVA